jgi:hypothetical protein
VLPVNQILARLISNNVELKIILKITLGQIHLQIQRHCEIQRANIVPDES